MPTSDVVAKLPDDARARLSVTLAPLVPPGGVTDARFLAAIELGYLVASADGLEPSERDVIAQLLEAATGRSFDVRTFDAHFRDLDAAVGMLGRRERLARTAAEFDTADRRADAIRFAALVAMADGILHEAELLVLCEAGSYFDWGAERVRAIVDDVVARAAAGSGGAA